MILFINYFMQVVKLLVDNGADLAKEDEEGMTPVTQASRNGRVRIMQWLLDQHPYGYLPSTYLPRNERTTTGSGYCYSGASLGFLFAWMYPAAEVVASVACCLPMWQTYSDPAATPLLADESTR